MTNLPRTATPWPRIARIDVSAGEVPVPAPAAGWYAAVRPVLDRVAAAVLLVAALPVIAVAWVAVRVSSPGPGFYTQTRTGHRGRDYTIVKLRTMRHDCERASGIRWATKGDARVTLVGKILRTTHLDELPQLFNVLRGEMSLVGPRPERPEVIRAKGLAEHVPGYDRRLDVPPGVTGFAQVQLPADTDLDSVRAKVGYDLFYIRHRTLWLDARLVVATALKAAGVGPVALRRLFFLPGPDAVAADAPAVVLEARAAAADQLRNKRRLAAA